VTHHITMQTEIINIGDELLIGQVINSNAAKMGQMLLKGGFTTKRVITIGDDRDAILSAIENRLKDTKILIFSGGLGPTRDDLTKNVLADYFDTVLVFNQEAYEDIAAFFKQRQLPVSDTNREQAYLPKACITLPNKVGTARGMWFEKEGLIVISLPGVPSEMTYLMQEQVLPRLIDRFHTQALHYRTIMTMGIGESFLADIIEEWEKALPQDMSLAYLPQYGAVRLRLSCSDTQPERSLQRMQNEIDKVVPLIAPYIYGYDEISMQEVVGQLLQEKGLSVACAESCTGGYISHLITSVPGSSNYYRGGIVAYHNEVKMKQLMVSEESLEQHGAVSQEVVEQMAQGARKALKADCAIATSGIAGPGGGSPEKPVGTIWIAVCQGTKTHTRKLQLSGNRSANIERSTKIALNMLRELLMQKEH